MSDKAGKRSGIFKVAAAVIVVLLAVIIALPFVVNVDKFRQELESRISTALGREVKLGKLKLSVLSGSVGVEAISIADAPQFSRSPFVNAKSLQVSVEMKPLILSRVVRVVGITLDRPSITLIRSRSGKWNFSDLGSGSAAAPSEPGKSGSFSGKDVSIKELKIVGGQVTIVREGERRKPSTYNDVNLTASDLSYTTAFPFTLAASLPGSGTVKLEGKAGPLNSQDMLLTPVTAVLDVKQFNLIASGFVPPESGLAGIVDFSGDIVSQDGQVRSKGRASVNKLQVAKNGSPAARPVSLQYAVDYNLANQAGTVQDVTIGYGKAMAHLNGNYEIREGILILKMMLRGANMPVQDLAALLPALGITLPRGASLQGGTLDANLATEGPVEKLVTTGRVDISKTRLTGFDLSGKMSALATLAGLRSTRDTEIEKFASGLRMSPEGIQASNLQLIVPAIGEMSGNGRIASDQSLDFVMNAQLKPGGALGTGLAALVKGGALTVPFFIRGSASDPKFVPDTKKAAGSLLGSALGKGAKGGETSKGDILGNTLRDLFQKKK